MAFLIDDNSKEKVSLNDAIISEKHIFKWTGNITDRGSLYANGQVEKEGYTPIAIQGINFYNDSGDEGLFTISRFDLLDGFVQIYLTGTGDGEWTVTELTFEVTVVYLKN